MVEDYSLLAESKGCTKFFTQSSSLFLFLVAETIYLHYFFSNSPNVCKNHQCGGFPLSPQTDCILSLKQESFPSIQLWNQLIILSSSRHRELLTISFFIVVSYILEGASHFFFKPIFSRKSKLSSLNHTHWTYTYVLFSFLSSFIFYLACSSFF